MKLTQFSQSDLPIITDEHFWIINTRAERLPKGITIKRTVVSVLPSAFWQESLLEKYLNKIQHT